MSHFIDFQPTENQVTVDRVQKIVSIVSALRYAFSLYRHNHYILVLYINMNVNCGYLICTAVVGNGDTLIIKVVGGMREQHQQQQRW